MGMKRDYDIVYLTNTPSFYKLNLCEAIAKRGVRIMLVLYGYGAEAVNRQMEHGEWSFDYHFCMKATATNAIRQRHSCVCAD